MVRDPAGDPRKQRQVQEERGLRKSLHSQPSGEQVGGARLESRGWKERGPWSGGQEEGLAHRPMSWPADASLERLSELRAGAGVGGLSPPPPCPAAQYPCGGRDKKL